MLKYKQQVYSAMYRSYGTITKARYDDNNIPIYHVRFDCFECDMLMREEELDFN